MVKGKSWVQVTFGHFMDKFVPAPSHTPFKPSAHCYDLELKYFETDPDDSRQEKKCFPTLCEFIERAYKGGRLMIKDVADWPQKSLKEDKNLCRVDLCSYLADMEAHWTDPEFRLSKSCDEGRVPFAARNSFVYAISGLKMKLENNGFKSTTDTEDFLLEGNAAARTRGQIMDYAAEIQLRGHRTHVFMVFVYRSTARVMRFDRNGVLVSREISLKAQQGRKTFYEFFYRLGRLSDEQLGLDPTATMIPGDTKFLHIHNSNWKALEVALNTLKTRFGDDDPLFTAIDAAFAGDVWPLYELRVPEDATSGSPDAIERTFLVRNLAAYSEDPTGRSTKGCIAFDPVSKRFVFLKDYWRPDTTAERAEFEVYKRLVACGVVRGVASVLCAGDLTFSSNLMSQTTLTDRYYFEKKKGHPLVHTRIVLNEVGLPLKEYPDSEFLVPIIFHAFQAHRDAFEKAGILHGDISDGNIVIYYDQDDPDVPASGLLIDWDLCSYTDELDQEPCQKGRSGTWRFMSGALLEYPRKSNSVSDDIESFYHVLALFALRFHRHEATGRSKEIRSILEQMYDAATMKEGFWVGSKRKKEHMMLGILPAPLTTQDRFSYLLQHLVNICKKHYEQLDHADLKRRFGIPRSTVVKQDVAPTAEVSQPKKRRVRPSAIPPDNNQVTKQTSSRVSASVLPVRTNSAGRSNFVSTSTLLAAVAHLNPVIYPLLLPVLPPKSTPSVNLGLSNAVAPPAPTPPTFPLNNHKAFYRAFMQALQVPDPQGSEVEDDEFPWTELEGLEWTEKDKTHDQFRDIDWSSCPGLSLALPSIKRNHSSAFPNTNSLHRGEGETGSESSKQGEAVDEEPVLKKARRS